MKIRPVEAELFHAERQADTTKVILAFHSFANEAKMEEFSVSVIFTWISGVDLRFTLAQDMSGTWKKQISILFFKQE